MQVNGKPLQSRSGRTATGPDPLGIKVSLTPPGKEPPPAEGKRNTEWVVERELHTGYEGPQPSRRKEDYKYWVFLPYFRICIYVINIVFSSFAFPLPFYIRCTDER